LSPTSAPSGRRRIESAASLLAVGTSLIGALCAPAAADAESSAPLPPPAAALEAEFGGCETAGWCRFRIESSDGPTQSLRRVRLDGVPYARSDDALAIAVRDRLNALLASMIHQHKRIRLHGLRELGDGTFAAAVTVNEADVASDPTLMELPRRAGDRTR